MGLKLGALLVVVLGSALAASIYRPTGVFVPDMNCPPHHHIVQVEQWHSSTNYFCIDTDHPEVKDGEMVGVDAFNRVTLKGTCDRFGHFTMTLARGYTDRPPNNAYVDELSKDEIDAHNASWQETCAWGPTEHIIRHFR